MDSAEPFALLLTWTCYGTWLPGDRRGYVSNTRNKGGEYEPKQNIPGDPITSGDSITLRHAATAQKHDSAALERQLARMAAQALIDACAARQWHILRAAIMWNHVHVVVTKCPDDGPEVRRILKGVSQNALSKHVGKPRRWWTAGGSDRYLHGEKAINAATSYVANQPGMLIEIVDMQIIEPRCEPPGLSRRSSPSHANHRRDKPGGSQDIGTK